MQSRLFNSFFTWFISLFIIASLLLATEAKAEYYFVYGDPPPFNVCGYKCHCGKKRHKVHRKRVHKKRSCHRRSRARLSICSPCNAAPTCASCVAEYAPAGCGGSCGYYRPARRFAGCGYRVYPEPDACYDPCDYADLATGDDDPLYDPQLNIDR